MALSPEQDIEEFLFYISKLYKEINPNSSYQSQTFFFVREYTWYM